MKQAEVAEVSEGATLAAARAGDPAAIEHLLRKYGGLVRMRARSYFMTGGDHDDVVQEGMIGLYKAVRDFRPDKLASFPVFAELCIKRQIITAIKTATRTKHTPLNHSVSLDKPTFRDDSDQTLADVLELPGNHDPEDLMIRNEFLGDLRKHIEHGLSELESNVLILYLQGKSYSEMSHELNRHAKSIDNTLQRIKRKIERNGDVVALFNL